MNGAIHIFSGQGSVRSYRVATVAGVRLTFAALQFGMPGGLRLIKQAGFDGPALVG